MLERKSDFRKKNPDISSLDPNVRSYLGDYIKENLAKGYSIEAIKIALTKYGFQEPLVNRLVKGYLIRNVLPKQLFFIILVFVIASLFLMRPAMIGYTPVEINYNYTDSVGLSLTENGEYLWELDNMGDLTSVRLAGAMSGSGHADVYLQYGAQQFLIFNSSHISAGSLTPITGAAVSDVVNEIETVSGEKSMLLAVEGGGSRGIDDVFELYISSSFSWDVDYNKLCTKWDINDISLCYGSPDCCALINLESLGEWNSSLYLSYGRYSAGLNNTVSAQLIYANYSLAIEAPYEDIVYSGINEVRADFYEKVISFEDICIETCLLPGFNLTSYKLVFAIENASLQINNIKYSIEKTVNISRNSPELIKEFENITLYRNKDTIINLPDYFNDKDNDKLIYSAYEADNISIVIDGSIARIFPSYNFTGKRYVYFTASDGYYNISSNIFSISVIEKPLSVSEVNVSEELVKPRIVINKPVRWVKIVNASAGVINLSINISSDALNVTVRDIKEDRIISEDRIKINDNSTIKNASAYRAEKRISQIKKIEDRLIREKEEIIEKDPTNKQAISSINGELLSLENERNRLTGYIVAYKEKGSLTKFFEWLFNTEITAYVVYEHGNETSITSVIIEDIVKEVEIEYYTEGPVSEEENITSGKRIVISSDIHYEDILAYTVLETEAPAHKVSLYWHVNDSRKKVEIGKNDTNGNNLIDYIEWVVPYLSQQTYELVIEITKAEHLDKNRNFISDIYGQVKEKDNIWSEQINNNEYVRVAFEKHLTKDNDIKVYVRANNSLNESNNSAEIEVYTKDSGDLITKFENISDEDWHKVYLTNLTGSHDTFDLKILGEIEFDYIAEPPAKSSYRITSERSYENCQETKSGKKQCTAVFGARKWIDDDGVFKNITDIVKMNFDHESGNLTYSYKKDYSVTSRLLFVINVSKDICKANKWDWINKDNACFLWPDKAKEFIGANRINYDVVITKHLDYYKYAVNLTGIPQNYQDKLDYVGLYLEKAKGLSWNDVKKKENKKGKSLTIKDKIHLNFDDLLERGFTYQLYDKRTVLIGNVKNKENLWLDPSVSFPGNQSDGYIRGKDTEYSTARSTAYDTSRLTNFFSVGQELSVGSPDYYYVYRGYLDFNTSSLPDNAIVSEVKVDLHVSSITIDDEDDDFNVTVYDFSWQEPLDADESVEEANYDAVGAVYDALWKNTSEISDDTRYNSSPLDTSWVNLTGDTKYQLRSSLDKAGEEPSGDESIDFYPAEYGVSANRPILYVDYTFCTKNSECPDGYFCNQTQWCVAKKSQPGTCDFDVTYSDSYDESDGVCSSGYCRDDYDGSSNADGNCDSGDECWCADAGNCMHNGAAYANGAHGADCYDTGESTDDADEWNCDSGDWGTNTCEANQYCNSSGSCTSCGTSQCLTYKSCRDGSPCCDTDIECGANKTCVSEQIDGGQALCSHTYSCRDAETLPLGIVNTTSYSQAAFWDGGDSSGSGLCGDHAYLTPSNPDGDLCLRYDTYDSDGSLNTLMAITEHNTSVEDSQPASGNNEWHYNYIYNASDTADFHQLEIRNYDTGFGNITYGYYISEQGGAADGTSSTGCCPNATSCVDDSLQGNETDQDGCYGSGTYRDADDDSDNDYCLTDSWVDCNVDTDCPSGEYCSGNNCGSTNTSANLTSPLDKWYVNNTIIFECSASSNVYLDNITLYHNYSGTWQSNASDTTIPSKTSDVKLIETLYSTEKTFIWNCYACDNRSGCAFANANRTLTIDLTNPNINFTGQTPSDSSAQTNDSVFVNVSASDASNNYSVILDWNRSLVGWWRLEQGNGTFFVDSSTYGNNGTCSGTYCPNITTGYRGKAYEFDGINDYVGKGAPSYGTNFSNGSFSISYWLKANSFINSSGAQIRPFQILSCSGGASIVSLVGVTALSTSAIFLYAEDSDSVAEATGSAAGSISLDTWHLHTAVIDRESKEGKMYIDGSQSGSTNSLSFTGNFDCTSTSIFIGSITTLGFNGSMDDVMIFSRALSPEEINASYNAQAYKYAHNFTSLSDGNYTYKAHAQDMAGNVNETEERTVIVDSTAPTVTIIYPANGSNISSNSIDINASATDALASSLTYYWIINGSLNTTTVDSNSTFNASDGYYNLTLFVSDGLQNGSDTVYFRLDTTAPEVSIIYPEDAMNISSNSIDVNASATDALASSLTYYWVINGTTNTTTVDSNSTFNASDGYYNLTLFVSDGLQNGSDTVYFRLDTIAPTISFEDPTPANDSTQLATNVEINVSITEANLNEVKFNWNGTNYTIFNDSVVLMMNFDNRSSLGENSTYVVDLSKYENNGAAYGDAKPNVTGGKYYGGFEFDGVDDYINISYDDSLNITQSITLSAWIKSNTAGRYILARDPPTENSESGATKTGWSNSNLEKLKIKKYADKYAFKSLDDNIIEIGTEKHSPSMPYLKLNKWDGEVSLKVNVPYVREDKPDKFENNKLRWSNKEYSVIFYPKEPEEITEIDSKGRERTFKINDEGGVEFDLVLKEKPESNVFSYEIETKNSVYYYQPPLNQEKQEAGLSCTETECVDEEGRIVTYRPENVVGSYAVYHATKMNNEYKTGKAFHIYRPKVYEQDNENNWIWGELNIDEEKGILSVSVEQDWLDNAVYPVVVDPTFGYTNAGGSGNIKRRANQSVGSQQNKTVSGNGFVKNVSIYITGGLGTQFKGFITNASLNILTNGVTQAADLGATTAWYTADYSTEPEVAAATDYYPFIVSDGNYSIHYDTGVSDESWSDLSNNFSSPIDPTDATGTDFIYSIYATYTSAKIVPYALNTKNGGEFLISNGIFYNVSASGDINDGNWHHIAATYNGSEMRIYIDGVLNASNTSYSGDLPTNTEDLWIGANYSSATSANFNGTIDEVMILDRALSAAEIQQLYFTNLYKYNSSQWYLYVNQNRNSTDGLSDGTYTYFASAKDDSGNENSTETRTVTIEGDVTPPGINFISPTPANASTQSATNVEINVSITEANLDEVKFNWNSTNYTIFNDSVVLFMNLDNRSSLGENNTYAVDISGYGNNGTVTDAKVDTTDCKYGNCFTFDGTGDNINFGDILDAELSSAFSLSMWLNISSNAGSPVNGIISKTNGTSGGGGIWLGQAGTSLGANKIIIYLFDGAVPSPNFLTTDTIPLNQWTHLTVVWNGTTLTDSIKIYFNGVKKAGGELNYGTTPAQNNLDLKIGPRDGATGVINGAIDEVMIFNRSLSAAEIQQIYFANLYKYNSSQWYLYVNQSRNSTDGLSDGTYTYFASAKDDSGNENSTETRTVTVDATAPSWSNNQTNASLMKINGNATFNITVSDYGSGLSFYIFSWNGTGVWVNDTNGTIPGSSVKLIVNKSTNLSQGNTIGYRWYANDSAGNWNNSLLRTFIVANTAPTTPNVTYPQDGKNYSDIPYINYSSADVDGDPITYNIYINNSLNISGISTNVTDWNASDGYYNLTVSASDSIDSSSNSTPVYFALDSSTPIVTLNAPANNTWQQSVIVVFNYTVTGSNLGGCVLYGNFSGTWKANETNSSPVSETPDIISLNLTNGTYLWNVKCNNSAGTIDWGNDNYTVNVDSIKPSFSNNQTNATATTPRYNEVVQINITLTDSSLDGYFFASNASGTMANGSYRDISGTNYTIVENITISGLTRGNILRWQVWVNDSAGNVNVSGIYTLEIKNTAPTTPDVTYPQDGKNYSDIAYINYSSTDVDGDPITYNIYINSSLNISGISTNVSDWNASDGYYNLTVSAYDSYDWSDNSSVIFRLDSGGPVITIISPIEKTYTVNWTMANISTDEAANCSYSLDNNSNITMNSSTSTSFYYNVTNITDGRHNITFYCNDTLNNIGSAIRKFAVDTNPPIISLEFPLSITYLDYQQNITFNYTPTGSLDVCRLYGNWSGTWKANQTETSITSGNTYNFTANLTDGNFIWNVWCNTTLSIGDFSAQGNQTFVIDTMEPSFSNPEKNETPNLNEDVRMNITITDNNPDSYRFFWNASGSYVNDTPASYTSGIAVSTTKTVTAEYTCWGYWANDSAGNSNTSSLNCFTTTNTAPTQPAVTSPYDGEKNNSRKIEFSSTDVDGDSITYTIYINNTFNITTAANITAWNGSDGYYNLTVTASDGQLSSSNSSVVHFTLDTTAPEVSIIYPEDAMNIISNSIDVNASASDSINDSSMTYYWVINGTTNTTTVDSNSTFNASDGYYNLTLFVSDGLQNGSDTVYFSLDTIAPSWSNNETNASLMGVNGNATFNITVSDNIGLSYYIFSWNGTGEWNNDTNGTIPGSSVKLIINKSSNLSKGNAVGYRWYANDSAGNWNNSLLRRFIVANTAPTTPDVTYPQDGKNYSDIPYINYSSIDVDGDPITYNIYINSSLNISGISTNVSDWNASDGYYNVTVSAGDSIDSSSNSTSTLFTLDSSTPIVTLNAPADDIWRQSGIVVFNYTVTGSNLDDCILYGNFSGTWKANETNSSPDSGNYDIINLTLTNGTYIWNVKCNNTAGTSGWAANNYTVSVDSIKPSFSNNQTNATASTPRYNEVVQINLTLSDAGLDGYFFASNASGTMANGSYRDISGTSHVVIENITISGLTRGNILRWQVWVNDSAGNVNVSDIYTLEIKNTAPTTPNVTYPVNGSDYADIPYINYFSTDVDGDPITYNIYINNSLNISGISTNVSDWNASDGDYNLTVSASDSIDSSSNSTSTLFTLDSSTLTVTLNKPLNDTWQQSGIVVFNYTIIGLGLEDCILYGNFSGTWKANETNSSPDSGNYDIITLTLGNGTYIWNVRCNNSAGTIGWGDDNYTISVDSIKPSFSNNQTNATTTTPRYNEVIQINITLTDSGLDGYFFASNASGTMANGSYRDISGTSHVVIENITISGLTRGDILRWQVWVNDSAGNVNVSDIYTLEIKNTAPTTPDVTYPVNGSSYADIPYINYSSTDVDGDPITYNIYINNSLNISGISANLTDWNASDGYYNLTVSASDSIDSSSNSTSTLFTLDASTPIVTLNAPANDTWQQSGIVVFNYTGTTATNLDDCILYGNFSGTWKANETNSSPDSGNYDIINLTLTNGTYIWNVKCNNTAGTSAWGDDNYTVSVDSIKPSFSNNQTNATATTPRYNEVVQINITLTDSGLDGYFFASNASGTMANGSYRDISGSSHVVIENITISGLTRGDILRWQVWVNDSAGNVNVSGIYTLEIKNTAPTTPNVTYPVNGSSYADIPYINYSSTDVDSDSITYNIYINGSLNISEISTNLTDWNASGGDYNLTVSASDSIDSSSNSTPVLFSLDSNIPVVYLLSPANGTITSNATQTFSCNITDNGGIANLTLYIWNSSGSLNYTNTTNLSGTANSTNWTYTLPYGGSFLWNCKGYDSFGNNDWGAEGNYTITLDTTAPVITRWSPSGRVTTWTFSMNVTTDENATCRYIPSTEGNLSINYSGMSYTFSGNELSHNETLTLADGYYEYYARCIDDYDNAINESTNISFTVNVETISITTTITGGGGGGSTVKKEIGKRILLNLDAPLNHTLFAGDEKTIKIKLKNEGDVPLTNIRLGTDTNAHGINLKLSKDSVDSLNVNEEAYLILNLKSLEKPTAQIGVNRYFITTNADVPDLTYRTSMKFFIDVKESDYETRIKTLKQMEFVEDLFEENPECSEFNEVIKQAQGAYDKSEYNKALPLIDSAIQACRDKIAPEEEIEEIEKLTPEKKAERILFLIEMIVILALLSATFYYYRKRKLKSEIKAKPTLESIFKAWFNETRRLIRKKDIARARQGYLGLYSLYKKILASSLPASIKFDCHHKLSILHSKLSRLIERYSK